jgi:hypothetical protein
MRCFLLEYILINDDGARGYVVGGGTSQKVSCSISDDFIGLFQFT